MTALEPNVTRVRIVRDVRNRVKWECPLCGELARARGRKCACGAQWCRVAAKEVKHG